MKTIVKSIIKKVIGVILIIYGIFALLTPFTPGSWLALIGMELLGIRQFIFRKFLNDKQRVAAEKFMEKLKSRFKKKTDDKPDEKQSH
jgi:c-di-AMP phosphodiesterase-like protein